MHLSGVLRHLKPVWTCTKALRCNNCGSRNVEADSVLCRGVKLLVPTVRALVPGLPYLRRLDVHLMSREFPNRETSRINMPQNVPADDHFRTSSCAQVCQRLSNESVIMPHVWCTQYNTDMSTIGRSDMACCRLCPNREAQTRNKASSVSASQWVTCFLFLPEDIRTQPAPQVAKSTLKSNVVSSVSIE